MSQAFVAPPERTPRPFNSPLECGLRMLFLLVAASRAVDLQRLVSYDYLLVHSGDVADGPASLHPAVPFRGTELLIKRRLIEAGLDQMFSRELIDKRFAPSGVVYTATENTAAFTGLLASSYAVLLRKRAAWVVKRFDAMADAEFDDFMARNIGRWGAEFERLTALDELELLT